MPLALPQADMTKASLDAMKTILSTPLARRFSRLAMYDVMCFSWQVGVKAPGTATRTAFLFLNSIYIYVRAQERKTLAWWLFLTTEKVMVLDMVPQRVPAKARQGE